MNANSMNPFVRRTRWFSNLVAAGVVAVLFSPGMLWAQSIHDLRLLTPREEQRLPKEALDAYKLGVKALDHIDAVTAIEQFAKASQLAPNAIELAFLTAHLAQMRGRMVFGDEAPRYYELAIQALERVGKQKNLPPLIKHRYETQMNLVNSEKKGLDVRNQRRMAIGIAFRQLYAKERYGLTEEGEEGKTKPKPKKPRPRPRPRVPVRPRIPVRGGGGGADSES